MKIPLQLVAASLLIVVAAACVSRGRNFSLDDARRVELGMTEAEVTAIMGEPTNTSIDLTGELWMWIYVDPGLNSKSFAVKVKDGKVIHIQR